MQSGHAARVAVLKIYRDPLSGPREGLCVAAIRVTWIAMSADVAEPVDARDLKFLGPKKAVRARKAASPSRLLLSARNVGNVNLSRA